VSIDRETGNLFERRTLSIANQSPMSMMNSTAQQLLNSFEQLPDLEKQQVATEILRRTLIQDIPELSDEALILNAEALFLSLDEFEADDEQQYSETR